MTIQKIGRYEIESELGRGGMAVVYKANDPRFERIVAIKVLPREFMHDPQFIGRFNREAKTIAALDHPAIVPVFDYGEEDGQPFLVMRYMPGGSLADKLENGPLPLPVATTIIQRLSSALNRAHSQGIVHRDLKPNNVLFDQYDDAYLADFGIAHISATAGSSAALTASGSMLGTPTYMSPEQIHGDSELDGRSDIYALGILFFQMLTGSVPYIGETATKILMKHIMDPIPDLRRIRPDLPVECQDVISKAMAKKPEQRFASADEMASAITVINDRVRFAEYTGSTPGSGTGQLQQPTMPPPLRTPTPPPPARPQTPLPTPSISGAGESFVEPAPQRSSLWIWVMLGLFLLLCVGGIITLAVINSLRGNDVASATATATPDPTATVDNEATQIAEVTAAFVAQQDEQATAQAGTATALFRPTITPGPTLTPPPSRTPTPVVTPEENTPVAAATNTRSSTSVNIPPVFGPENGELPHQLDDFIETYYVEADLRDFIIQSSFSVPFTALEGIWDIGYIFRQTEGDDAMRLVVRSNGYWSLNNRVGTEDNFIVEGNISAFLNLRTSQINTMTLITHGDRGYFLFNGNFVSVLDLSNNDNAGDIALGTGFYTDDEREGATTAFTDFAIWAQEPDFGPAAGTLEHLDDGFIESFAAAVRLTNFVADATFINPYAGTADQSWDAGFAFRELDSGDQFWIVADSTNYWGLIDRADDEDNFLQEGETDLLNLGANEENRLTLITWNEQGYFLINDELVTTLDLSNRVAAGDVSVITAFFIENEVPGTVTGYEAFTIWPLP